MDGQYQRIKIWKLWPRRPNDGIQEGVAKKIMYVAYRMKFK